MLVKDGRYIAKRIDPASIPVGSGISGISVASSTAVATTALAIDQTASAGPSPTAPLLTIEATTTPSSSPTLTGAVSNSIPVGTVIGSCIGAFVFVCALIIFGIWFYRRYSQSLKKQALTRGRGLPNDKHRRQWNKLEDDGDKWEGMNQTKEVDQVVPMEKLTMFKRAASVRTAYTQKSIDDHTLAYPQSFAPFDANLVRTLSADIDPKSQPSQVANSVKGQIPNNIPPSSGLKEPLSSSLNMAIPTPEATVLQSHKWESAEVVQYEEPSAEVVEPSVQDKETNRRSLHNPFFGSQGYIRSRSNSHAHAEEKSANAKGKERMHDSMSSSLLASDPFEALVSQLPKPIITHHQLTDSSASTESKTRALQTLMGALELSEDEINERLRVASMHPSEMR
jgi:hypothetical protein